MTTSDKIFAAIWAFWPFVLVLILGNMAGIHAFAMDLQGWWLLGKIISLLTLMAIVVMALNRLINWCLKNYRAATREK